VTSAPAVRWCGWCEWFAHLGRHWNKGNSSNKNTLPHQNNKESKQQGNKTHDHDADVVDLLHVGNYILLIIVIGMLLLTEWSKIVMVSLDIIL